MSCDPPDRFEHVQGSGREIHRWYDRCQTCQGRAQPGRLLLKTTDPELATLIRHVRLRSRVSCFSQAPPFE